MGVLVLLHVQIDELGSLLPVLVNVRIVNSSLIQLRHTAHQLRERLLIVQSMSLGIDTRNLHRYIVDIWLLQSFKITIITLVGLLVAKHHLAEQVDILANLLLKTGSKMLRQMRTRRIYNHT